MEYLTAADRAKHVRAELKAMFPKTKFSVKSQTYSMGSNVNVTWTDGPTEDAVQNVIDCLTEDMKNLHDIAINTYHNMITVDRKISKEVLEAVRKEVIEEMTAKNDPYITDSWTVERKVSYEVEGRSFL